MLAAPGGRYCFNFTGPGAGAWTREKKTDSFVRRRVLALARIEGGTGPDRGWHWPGQGGGTGPDRQLRARAGAAALMFAPTNAAHSLADAPYAARGAVVRAVCFTAVAAEYGRLCGTLRAGARRALHVAAMELRHGGRVHDDADDHARQAVH